MSFKKVMGSISDKLKLSGGAITDAIKQNTQYINAELRVSKMSQEGINALKTYIDAETPRLKTSVSALVRKIENIEKVREEKANQLQKKFIDLLHNIVEKEKILNEKLKNADVAQKALIKAENKLAKLEAKPEEKKNPEQIDEAKAVLKESEITYRDADAEAKSFENVYNKEKFEIMESILKNIADIEGSFHQKALNQIGAKKEETINL